MGGALAQLASHDIKTAAEQQMGVHLKLLCYTFGSPRVGNHAFAREYNKVCTLHVAVPYLWQLVYSLKIAAQWTLCAHASVAFS